MQRSGSPPRRWRRFDRSTVLIGRAPLGADGLVYDGIIECPLHMGQFDIETGEAISGPVCVDRETHAVTCADGKVFIRR